MYNALKTAQNSVNESLLRFADEITLLAEQRALQKAQPNVESQSSDELTKSILTRLTTLELKQATQYDLLCSHIQKLNESIVDNLNSRNANTIPSILPVSSNSDIKQICVESVKHVVEDTCEAIEDMSSIEGNDADVESGEVEEVEEESGEAIEEEEEESGEAIEEEEDATELEVEEWEYKGRMYFKDDANTVYANDNGDVGDAIGLYDPKTKTVKKLAPK